MVKSHSKWIAKKVGFLKAEYTMYLLYKESRLPLNVGLNMFKRVIKSISIYETST